MNGSTNPSAGISRRAFQQRIGAIGAASLIPGAARAGSSKRKSQAKSCILLWLGGGMCHVDTFDVKRQGDPKSGKPGSAYASIPTAVSGIRVCEHLRRTATLMDRGVLIRTLNHPLKVDHADSTNLVKTGRLTSGTVVYPSLGSVVSHQLGALTKGIPPYIVMGYPNVTRGPGFLGSRYGFVYLTNSKAGPTGLKRARDVSKVRQEQRKDLLNFLRKKARGRSGPDRSLLDYDASISEAQAMMSGSFSRVFDLSREKASTRSRYGGEFGQRCLLARRLVAAGTRFVEVAYDLNFKNGTGWDTHRHGQAKQHLLIEDLDRALSALLIDLEKRQLLDKTLVIVATEFGRPAEFDAQGGRGHQSAAFSAALFGGGLKSGQAVGVTDEWGRRPVARPVSVPDFHATILAALGIDHAKLLYDGDRPIPITDHGKPITEVIG